MPCPASGEHARVTPMLRRRRGRISVVLSTRPPAPHAREPIKVSRGPLGGAAAHCEFWIDEIGYYRFTLKNGCPKAAATIMGATP
jgi:hypothetical protein